MTKYAWPDVIPDFDVWKWKEETQAEILRETEGMTREEVREYFRTGSEEFQKELAQIRAAKAAGKTASQSARPRRLAAESR